MEKHFVYLFVCLFICVFVQKNNNNFLFVFFVLKKFSKKKTMFICLFVLKYFQKKIKLCYVVVWAWLHHNCVYISLVCLTCWTLHVIKIWIFWLICWIRETSLVWTILERLHLFELFITNTLALVLWGMRFELRNVCLDICWMICWWNLGLNSKKKKKKKIKRKKKKKIKPVWLLIE